MFFDADNWILYSGYADNPSILLGLPVHGSMFALMVMMPVTTTGMNALPLNLIGDGTVVNNTARQMFASMGTAILVSIMASETTKHLPSQGVAHATPILFGKLSLHANVVGFRWAFFIATLFSLVGFVLTFFLKRDSRRLG